MLRLAFLSKTGKLLNKNVLSLFAQCKMVGSFKRPQTLSLGQNHSVTLLKSRVSNLDVITPGEWKQLRANILSESNRYINEVNIDATILGVCVADGSLATGKSYVNYLQSVNMKPKIGAVGKLLRLYYTNGDKLDNVDRQYLLTLYVYNFSPYG